MKKVKATELKKNNQLVIGQIYDVVIDSGPQRGKTQPRIFQGYRYTGDKNNPEDMLIFANLKGNTKFLQFPEFITIQIPE
jgi:hypothetical protein